MRSGSIPLALTKFMKFIRIDSKVVYSSKFRGPTYASIKYGKNADVTDTLLAFLNKLFKQDRFYISYD